LYEIKLFLRKDRIKTKEKISLQKTITNWSAGLPNILRKLIIGWLSKEDV
jgi:hypothetical protein